jgi:hypothetical protein
VKDCDSHRLEACNRKTYPEKYCHRTRTFTSFWVGLG